MRIAPFALAFFLAVGVKCASCESDVSDRPIFPDALSITTVIPGFSYLARLGCSFYLLPCDKWDSEHGSPCSTLLLNFTIARTKPEDNHALLLNDLHLNPLYYERRIPMLMSGPDYPSLPPLSADLVSPPASRDTPRRKSVQLAYEYTGIDYMPGDDSKDWLAVLELQTTGLRSGSTNRQVTGCAETPQGPTAVILKIRIWLSYDNEHMEKRIEAIKLIPIPQKRGDKGIAEGRFDINDNKHVWVTRASFQPQEWNDCGRKDDKMRQVMCKVEDFTDRLKIYLDPHIILTLFVVLCIFVFVGLCGLVWLSWRAIRSAWMRRRSMTIRPTSRSESSKAVERAPLLDGDEDLEEEEAEQVYG